MIYEYEDFLKAGVYRPHETKKQNLSRALKYVVGKEYHRWEDWRVVQEIKLDRESRCACSHPIKLRIEIQHAHTGESVIIGSKCINHFNNKEMTDAAKKIEIKHKDPDAEFCRGCSERIRSNAKWAKYGYHYECYQMYACPACKNNKDQCSCRRCCDCTGKIPDDKPGWVIRCLRCYLRHKQKQ